ncbi:hypothetical protein DW061_18880, partial [Ruminococcus sp. AF42-9BH]
MHLNDNMDLLPGTIDLILVETDKDGSKAKKVKKFILNGTIDLILVETDKDGSKAKKVKKFILNN